uniref:MULE transposase domain-containing protein n=1 Tax=Cannabis sativa TaxID=3483 RepID=A0A803P1Z8_CANSA
MQAPTIQAPHGVFKMQATVAVLAPRPWNPYPQGLALPLVDGYMATISRGPHITESTSNAQKRYLNESIYHIDAIRHVAANVVFNEEIQAVQQQVLQIQTEEPQADQQQVPQIQFEEPQAEEDFELEEEEHTSYRTKNKAMKLLEGSVEEKYRILDDYCKMVVSTNPRSTAILKTRLEDGCFLKGYCKGMLLTTIGIDGSNSMFPIAYAICEKEDTYTWTWFFHLLKEDLYVDNPAMFTMMSDKQKGLEKAIAEIWEGAKARNCVRHLHSNFKKEFPGLLMKQLPWAAARQPLLKNSKGGCKKLRMLIPLHLLGCLRLPGFFEVLEILITVKFGGSQVQNIPFIHGASNSFPPSSATTPDLLTPLCFAIITGWRGGFEFFVWVRRKWNASPIPTITKHGTSHKADMDTTDVAGLACAKWSRFASVIAVATIPIRIKISG